MHEPIEQLEKNISAVVLGKDEVVRRCIIALLAGEHILLEDVPGVGKAAAEKVADAYAEFWKAHPEYAEAG